MKLFCIFAKRPEDYEGQYAPELLASIDEYGDMDNPDYLNKEHKKANRGLISGEFLFVKRMTIEIDDKKFNTMFYGEPLSGNIL